MKLKFKPAWIGLFLIGVMLFSTFAYAVIQSLYPQQNVQLPTSNIINYELDANLKNALIQYGATIIKFDYNLGCNNCINQKSLLESFANEFKQQIWLQEIVTQSLDESKIDISSFYGEDSLIDANETEIVNSLCNLMVAPPVTCAIRKT